MPGPFPSQPVRIACCAVIAMLAQGALAQPVDVAGAEALLQKNKCGKCHSVDKKKDGPPYRQTATKYKGKADAEATLVKHMLSGRKVKIDDVEEEHPVLKASDAEARNAARYVLSR